MLIFYFRDVVRRLVPAALSAIQIAAVAAALLCLATPVNDVAILPALFLIVAATWTDSGLFARLIGLRPFVYLGDISYSVYLNHVLSLQVVRFIWSYALARGMIGAGTASVILPIASLAVTLLASHLTFRLVEAPARHWLTQRILGRRDRPIELSPPAP
jgi:peptidoglycan/LPS O-acetylase OafA/YrhL